MNEQEEEFGLKQLYRARSKEFRTPQERRQEFNRIKDRIRGVFNEVDAEYEASDEKLLVSEPPKPPDFPFVL